MGKGLRKLRASSTVGVSAEQNHCLQGLVAEHKIKYAEARRKWRKKNGGRAKCLRPVWELTSSLSLSMLHHQKASTWKYEDIKVDWPKLGKQSAIGPLEYIMKYHVAKMK